MMRGNEEKTLKILHSSYTTRLTAIRQQCTIKGVLDTNRYELMHRALTDRFIDMAERLTHNTDEYLIIDIFNGRHEL